jgi:NAD(P)H-dependent flavin oxidoreductase YrpB (nitropropane dioxygenase family)
MLGTRFTELVGCRIPIQLAAMPGICTPELVAAVTHAGGLGMTGMPLASPPVFAREVERLSALVAGPFGVNFLIPFVNAENVEIAAHNVRVVEFFFGDPDARLVSIVHRGGAIAGWQVGSRDEAQGAAEAGCDYVVLQGVEAGGHVRGTTGLVPLLEEVAGRLEVPVVAAGGIGGPAGVAAALAAGADGVRIGTRFLVAEEAGTHPAYQRAVIEARAEDTVLTGAFSVMWPDAPHRVLDACVRAAGALDGDAAGEMEVDGQLLTIPRFGIPCPTRGTTGAIEAMALYAGQGVGVVERVEPAGAIVADLSKGAAERLARFAPGGEREVRRDPSSAPGGLGWERNR